MESSSARLGTRYAGRYDLLGVLGEGGMGAVYRARHAFTGADVALKIMHSSVARSQTARDRFLREAQAPSAIGHPSIVSVTDAGVADDGTLYLALELLEGENLGDAVERGSVDGESLIAHTMELLDALGAAHASGIVHRDIKPDNVFLVHAEDGARHVRLLDFGITHHVADTEDKLTQTGTILGTPNFMSPEQASGRAIDARSDLYSVGATMFYALTGQAPFEEPNYNLLIVAIMTRPAPPIHSVRPEVPADLAAVVDRSLSALVEDRFRSAAEMRAALGACAPSTLEPIVSASVGFAATEASMPGQPAPMASGGGHVPTRTSGAARRQSASRPAEQAAPPSGESPTSRSAERSGSAPSGVSPASVPGAPGGTPARSRTGRVVGRVAGLVVLIGAAAVAGIALYPAADDSPAVVDAGVLMQPVMPVTVTPGDILDAGATRADGAAGSSNDALAARLAELEAEAAERDRIAAEEAENRARAQKRAAMRREEQQAQEARDLALARQRCNIDCMQEVTRCRRSAGADRQAANECSRTHLNCMSRCR